jgi:hypothetical protein
LGWVNEGTPLDSVIFLGLQLRLRAFDSLFVYVAPNAVLVAMGIAVWPFVASSVQLRRAGTHREHRWVARALAFSRIAQRSFTLQPAHSLDHPR